MQETKRLEKFLSKGNTCLFDAYIFPFKISASDTIVYPSVRHALVSLKTDSPEIKRQITEILLPSNLRDFEQSIPPPPYWTKEFILEHLYLFTLKKFKENKQFEEKLLNASEEDIRSASIGMGDYGPATQREEKEVVIKVRSRLLGALFG